MNDLIVEGAEPRLFLDYLGLSKLDPTNTTAMIAGVAKGCEIAGCSLIGGECAEMPDIYAPGDFDVAGFCVGVVEPARVMKQPKPKVGDIVLGLASSGVHSNGYTLVRRIIADERLSYTKKYAELGGKRLIDVLLEPTRIYAREVIGMLDAFYSSRRIPIAIPLFIAVTALSRLIILQGKDTDPSILLYESGAILLIAIAGFVVSRIRQDEA